MRALVLRVDSRAQDLELRRYPRGTPVPRHLEVALLLRERVLGHAPLLDLQQVVVVAANGLEGDGPLGATHLFLAHGQAVRRGANSAAQAEAEERLVHLGGTLVQVRRGDSQQAPQLGREGIEAGAVEERRVTVAQRTADQLDVGQRVGDGLALAAIQDMQVLACALRHGVRPNRLGGGLGARQRRAVRGGNPSHEEDDNGARDHSHQGLQLCRMVSVSASARSGVGSGRPSIT